MCEPCARERGAIIRNNIEFLAASARNRLSLITLTLAHSTRKLHEQLARLLAAFREMRRLRFWKDAVTGGCWTLEVKRGADQKWHPHLHVLVDASYIPHGTLCAAWHACTRDSYIVDVRRISAGAGARYISKYVTKPADNNIYTDDDSLQQFMLSIKGKRTTAAFGSWRKMPLAEKRDDEKELGIDLIDTSPQNWTLIGPLDQVIRDAFAGIQSAITLCDDLGISERIAKLRRRPPPCSPSP
jgi:hypothetical protein